VHLRAPGGGIENEKWFMVQDLIVEETRREMIFLGETVLQVCGIRVPRSAQQTLLPRSGKGEISMEKAMGTAISGM